jgi:hypothetical protein
VGAGIAKDDRLNGYLHGVDLFWREEIVALSVISLGTLGC